MIRRVFCDLHIHSSASDGTDAPGALARLAAGAGLAAFALTDHDTTAGVPAAAEAAEAAGLPFVPGIELSANPDLHGRGDPVGTLHILGLFVRHDDDRLADIQQRLRTARDQRNPEMVDRLISLGVKITYDEVAAAADGEIVGRPHIAQVLVNKGYARSIHEAFTRYVGSGGAAYVRKDRLTAEQAIDAIHHAGGLAAMAHPIQFAGGDPEQVEHAVKRLAECGIDAIETHHSDHGPADVARYQALAERYGLLATGGSDYHGSRKSVALGAAGVPLELYHTLCDAAG